MGVRCERAGGREEQGAARLRPRAPAAALTDKAVHGGGVVGVGRAKAQLAGQVDGVEDGGVLGQHRRHLRRVLLAHALLLKLLLLLRHLALARVVKLQQLLLGLARLVLHLGLGGQVVAQAHGDAVGNEVGEAHQQRRLDGQVGARHGGHDGEGWRRCGGGVGGGEIGEGRLREPQGGTTYW